MEFEYFKPDTNSDQQWQDSANKMPWSSIYTFDAPKNHALKFKVKVREIAITQAILDSIEIQVARHANDPAHPPTWVKYKLSAIGRLSPDKKEVWCTISSADMASKVKIPIVGSAIRHSSMDFIADHNISSYSDSNFVDGWWKPRLDSYPLVNARGLGNSTDVIITEADSGEAVPAFSAKTNRDYLISGGAMYTALRVAEGGKEIRALCHETPDWLYVSGHGWHSAQPAETGAPAGYPSGCLESIDGDGFGQRQYVVPEEVNWKGVGCAIIAGCSVLDINDYNGFYSGTDHTDSPGKRWAATGPALLLGYNQGGPSDRNGGLEIIQRFFGSNPVATTAAGRVEAWILANSIGNSWNACAIIPNDSYYFFKYTSFGGHKIGEAVWTRVAKSDW